MLEQVLGRILADCRMTSTLVEAGCPLKKRGASERLLTETTITYLPTFHILFGSTALAFVVANSS
jgi:hypothetical protein